MFVHHISNQGFLCETWASQVAQPACNAGDCLQCRRCGFDPSARKIPREGRGNLLQYSCLGNAMDRGTWQLQSMGCKSQI